MQWLLSVGYILLGYYEPHSRIYVGGKRWESGVFYAIIWHHWHVEPCLRFNVMTGGSPFVQMEENPEKSNTKDNNPSGPKFAPSVGRNSHYANIISMSGGMAGMLGMLSFCLLHSLIPPQISSDLRETFLGLHWNHWARTSLANPIFIGRDHMSHKVNFKLILLKLYVESSFFSNGLPFYVPWTCRLLYGISFIASILAFFLYELSIKF